MRILLTGSTGQLGNALIKFKPNNINIITPNRQELNLENTTQCFNIVKEYKPDWIINSAAYTKVDQAEEEQELAFAVNEEAPKAFSKAIKIYGGKLLHLSTDFVFSGKESKPYIPQHEIKPLNIYGQSKANGEIGINEILNQTNQSIILRTSWLMGPVGKNFALTMLRLHQKSEEIRVVSDQIGAPTTTYSLAKICWKLINMYSNKNDKNITLPSILHWSNAGIASWYDIAIAIGEFAISLKLLDHQANVLPISTSQYPTNAKRPIYSVLDCTETIQLLAVKQTHWKNALYEILKKVSIEEIN